MDMIVLAGAVFVVFVAGVAVGFAVTLGGIIRAEREPDDELDPAEVQRRVEGHEHAWVTDTTARNLVRFERCTCGATRIRKGGAR